MGFRVRKSFKIAPGVRVNVGKKGLSASIGGRGLRYNIHSSGRRITTVGIPGSGISYSTFTSSNQGSRNYRSSAYQYQRELDRQRKEQEKLQQIERNRLEVQLFENKIERIKSIHKEADEPVDWNTVLEYSPPFEKNQMGPRELLAKKKFEKYKPSFFAKLFKQVEKQREKLEQELHKAIQEDQLEYAEWEEMIHTAKRVVAGDIDTYFEVIEEFSPLSDLVEFGSDFEFFTDDSTYMEIEFNVHSEKVVPSETLSLTKTGKVSRKEMPKGKFYDIQQDYVCSCVIRIARDMFAILPIDTIYVHANDNQLNTATGHLENQTILSVKISKQELEKLNFEYIDCSDAIGQFIHNMKFKKTQGFQAVPKLEIIG